ncbi:MAG: hypothetical protein KIH01_04225 [Candidatus Freyarchaeota archaeon]|nr:hypothetical protein [Candidatus Jordarchaeia archaeon]
MSFSKDEMLEALRSLILDLLVKTHEFLERMGHAKDYSEMIGQSLALRVQKAFGKDKGYAITYLNLLLKALGLPLFQQDGKKYQFECSPEACPLVRTATVTQTKFSHDFCELLLTSYLTSSGFSAKSRPPSDREKGRIEAK